MRGTTSASGCMSIFIWDPRVHAKLYHSAEQKRQSGGFSFSQKKCIERALKEHEAILSEFESIMRGIESSLEAAKPGTAPAYRSGTVRES